MYTYSLESWPSDVTKENIAESSFTSRKISNTNYNESRKVTIAMIKIIRGIICEYKTLVKGGNEYEECDL